MREFDAFHGYPEPKEPRLVGPYLRTIHNRIAASYRDREFYDGARINGYGGFKDDGRWKKIAMNIFEDYNLGYAKVLQINAHKGFLLHELYNLGCRVYGTETSDYAIANSAIKLDKCDPWELPFEDGHFDMVIGQSVVYGQNLSGAIKVLKEIERVKKFDGRSWVSLAAYEDEEDIEGLMLLRYWFLLGTTILTKSDWIEVMKHAGYRGDYRFDTAKYLNLRRA